MKTEFIDVENDKIEKEPNKNRGKFLPIGTVVMLQGGTKKLMITGFAVIPKEDTSKMYDYVGCLYPEGFLASDTNLLFNHEQIAEIYYLGFENDEEIEFKKNINETLAIIKARNSSKEQ